MAVIRHGDRTPKQKMKMEVRHPKFFQLFDKHGGNKKGHVKLKRPSQLQVVKYQKGSSFGTFLHDLVRESHFQVHMYIHNRSKILAFFSY